MAFNLPNSQLNAGFVASTYSTEIGFPIVFSASNNRESKWFTTNEPFNSNHTIPFGRIFEGLTFSSSFSYPDQTEVITLYQSSGRLAGYSTQSITVREVPTLMSAVNGTVQKWTQNNLNSVFTIAAGFPNTVACDYSIATPSNSFFYCSQDTNVVQKVTIYGSQSWTYDHGAQLRCIAVDRNGNNVYIGGSLASNLTTRKLSATGSVVWSVNHGSQVNCIAIDTSNNVYTGGNTISNLTTRKYGPTGSLLWSVDHGAVVRDITVNTSGDVYTGGSRNANIGATLSTTRKYNSSGTLQWSRDHGSVVKCIAIDSSGNIYTGGIRTSNLTTRKYNSSGTLLWSVDHGSDVNGIAIDVDNNLYTTSSSNGRKYDLNGNLIAGPFNISSHDYYQTLDTLPSTRNQL